MHGRGHAKLMIAIDLQAWPDACCKGQAMPTASQLNNNTKITLSVIIVNNNYQSYIRTHQWAIYSQMAWHMFFM